MVPSILISQLLQCLGQRPFVAPAMMKAHHKPLLGLPKLMCWRVVCYMKIIISLGVEVRL